METVVKQLDAVSGIEAKLVKTSSTGTDTYSVVLSSEATGLSNGFQLTAGGNSRWETSATPTTNTSSNAFSQLSRDASLQVNNVAISRSSNTITDVIAGTTLKLQADTTATVNLSSSRSKDNVMSSVKDMISNY